MGDYFHLPSHYLSYLIGLGIFAIIYFIQKAKMKAQTVSTNEVEL